MQGAPSCVRRVAAVLLAVGVTTLVRAQHVHPGQVLAPSSDAFRAQIIGVRRIQFRRRPAPTTGNHTSGGRDASLHAAMTASGSVSTADEPRPGSAEVEAEIDVHGGTGSSHVPTPEELERHWKYRRMLLQRERERLLHHLPAAAEGHAVVRGNTNNNNNTTTHNSTGGGVTKDTRNCTEYSVMEGTSTVRLCDEVHLLNSTGDADRAAPTTVTPSGSSALTEAELAARHGSLPGGGRMNGRDWIGRERHKQARLFMIQARILQKLGIQRQPHVSPVDLSDNDRSRIMTAFRMYESQIGSDQLDEGAGYVKTLGLLTPSCDLPRNTNRAWWDGSRFRLYFQTQSPQWRNTKIYAATLLVYKRAIENCDTCYLRFSDPHDHQVERPGRRRRQKRTQDGSNQDNRRAQEDPGTTISPLEEEQEQMTEESIKITVYAYTKSVKARRKEKVQELHSMIVPRSEEGWIKLDIKNAVADWYQGTLRNFGLKVRLTDHRHRDLDPFTIITPTNCSLNNNFSLPYPLMQGGDVGNGTDIDGNQTTPYLSLVMLGMPRIQRIQMQRHSTVVRHRREADLRMDTNVPQNPVPRQNEGEPLRRSSLSSLLQRLSENVGKSKTRVTLQSNKKAQQL